MSRLRPVVLAAASLGLLFAPTAVQAAAAFDTPTVVHTEVVHTGAQSVVHTADLPSVVHTKSLLGVVHTGVVHTGVTHGGGVALVELGLLG